MEKGYLEMSLRVFKKMALMKRRGSLGGGFFYFFIWWVRMSGLEDELGSPIVYELNCFDTTNRALSGAPVIRVSKYPSWRFLLSKKKDKKEIKG